MTRRWFIVPVIGTGTKGDPYRVKLSIAHSALIPSNPDGTPRFNWALCLVSAADFTALDADTEAEPFPGVSLDDQLSSISAAARNRIQTALINRGVDLTGIDLNSTVRDVVERVVERLDARLDHRKMQVPE